MKKFISVFLALISAASLAVGLSACEKNSDNTDKTDKTGNEEITVGDTDEETGKFYTLKEAYENGYLTQSDLMSIAYYHNGEKSCSLTLDENVSKSIKKAWAKKLADGGKDSYKNLTDSDVSIDEYYGTYNKCVTVIVDLIDAEYAQVYNPYTVEIGNVVFNYCYPRPQIIVWKN